MEHEVDSGSVPETDTWGRAALERLTRLPGVWRIGLALAEGGGRRLLFVASDRDNEHSLDWCIVDAYHDVPLNTVVRTGNPVAGSLEELHELYPEFIGRQSPAETRALASVPIRAAGQVLGGFVLFYDQAQPFDAAQRAALDQLGASLGANLRRVQRGTTRQTRSLSEEPVPHGACAATHSVIGDVRAVAPARHFLRATLAAWSIDDDSIETAILCLSELVTNAIVHTAGGCELRVVLDDGVLTTTVRDGGAAVLPTSSAMEPLDVHGRGLQLVGALATRWGSELDADGTSVWFVLEPETA